MSPTDTMSEDVRALRLRGDDAYAAGRWEDAIAAFEAALALEPNHPPLHFNIGNALRYLKRRHEALAAYERAIALAPNFAMAHHNRATCLLQVGRLAEGFQEYEWRKACPGFADDERYRLPRPWRGEDIRGKRLYIYRELFQGDLIQFGRYAAMAEHVAGARVTLSAPPAMHALLRTMSPGLTLVDDAAPPPDYDVNTALMTLPALFGTTLETVPTAPRYLAAETARVMKWRERIGTHGLKVGIAWQGSANAAQRSFPLAVAAQVVSRVPGVRLISLQKHNGLEQLDALPPGQVETLGPDFDPGPDAFVDTAAAMECCDAFITPDTSVVHVSGALGRPTCLALPWVGDWRWREEQADSPWYPSVRIFRQPTEGDWTSAFEQMASELAKMRPSLP